MTTEVKLTDEQKLVLSVFDISLGGLGVVEIRNQLGLLGCILKDDAVITILKQLQSHGLVKEVMASFIGLPYRVWIRVVESVKS